MLRAGDVAGTLLRAAVQQSVPAAAVYVALPTVPQAAAAVVPPDVPASTDAGVESLPDHVVVVGLAPVVYLAAVGFAESAVYRALRRRPAGDVHYSLPARGTSLEWCSYFCDDNRKYLKDCLLLLLTKTGVTEML